MNDNKLNIVPVVLGVIGLIADVIGIYTFWGVGAGKSETSLNRFFPIAELILAYSGVVFVWFSFNKRGRTFSFDDGDSKILIPAVAFSVLTLPIQIFLCGGNYLFNAIVFQFGGAMFIFFGGLFLYKWQHLND